MRAVPLEDVLTSLESGARPPGGASADSGEIPSLGGEHLSGDGGFDFTSLKRIPRAFFEAMRGGRIAARDILVVKDGATTGKTSFVRENFPFADAAVNEHVFRVCVDQRKAWPEYVFHFLRSSVGQRAIALDLRGATVGGISREFAGKVRLPVPPLSEQRQIADILDKADALRAKRRAALAQFDTLTQSIFLDMFGDPLTNPKRFPIRNLAEFYLTQAEGTKCGPFGSALRKNELVADGIPVWNMDNIDPSGRMILPFRMWIAESKYRELAGYAVADGDVLISRAGTVGKMCVANTGGLRSIISTNLIRLRFGPDLLPLHFVSLMTYCKGRVGRLKNGADGALTHMSTGILNTLKFPYPPLRLQRKFAEAVTSIERQKDRIAAHHACLDALSNALQHRAFRGEL